MPDHPSNPTQPKPHTAPVDSNALDGRTMARRWARACFSLDPRSLAVFRIGLGALLLIDLAIRATDLEGHYSDNGLLPRAARVLLASTPWAVSHRVSLHMLSGEVWFQALLFGVAALVALALTLGWRTRIATILSWFLLCSLQARNPLVIQGGDDLLRFALFWSMFLPLNRYWSLDARRLAKGGTGARLRQPAAEISWGSAAFILQLACLYWFTATLKSHPVWRSELSAVYYALSCDHYASWLGRQMLQWPTFLRGLTFTTLVLEYGGPVVLLTGHGRWRMYLVGTFIAGHLGLAFALELGLFPVICIVYWLAILPTTFWETVGALRRRFTKSTASPAIALPAPPAISYAKSGPGRYAQWLAAVLLVYMLAINVARAGGNGWAEVPGPLGQIGRAAHLHQFWALFAPRPVNYGGWFSFKGVLADGSQVNLLSPREMPYDTRPENANRTFPNQRWRKLLFTLRGHPQPETRELLANYLARRWNDRHPFARRVVRVEWIEMYEPTNPPALAGSPEVIDPRTLVQREYP